MALYALRPPSLAAIVTVFDAMLVALVFMEPVGLCAPSLCLCPPKPRQVTYQLRAAIVCHPWFFGAIDVGYLTLPCAFCLPMSCSILPFPPRTAARLLLPTLPSSAFRPKLQFGPGSASPPHYNAG